MILVDHNDLKTGFAVGRAARLSDWAFRKEQADSAREIKRLLKLRSRKRKPEVYRAQSRRYEAEHKAHRAQQRRRRYWAARAHKLALQRASRLKHKAKRNAESLAYYYAKKKDDPAFKEKKREYDKKRAIQRRRQVKDAR